MATKPTLLTNRDFFMYDSPNIKPADGTCRNRMLRRNLKIINELSTARLTVREITDRLGSCSTKTVYRDLECLMAEMVVFKCEITGKFYRNPAW